MPPPVTDGHEVPSDATHEDYARRILSEVERGHGDSQRSLARRAGIALGLTNLVLKKLIRTGLVRIAKIKPNRVRYLITPAGLAEKARMSSAYFAYTTRFYTEARDRIRERFAVLASSWPASIQDAPAKRVVFYGANEVAEIGYVCLQGTELTVVAVVDDVAGGRFLGMSVKDISWLHTPERWSEFEMLIVMAFSEAETARARRRLAASPFPADRVFWI